VRGKPIEWPHIHTHEALSGALGMAPGAINKGQEMRMGKVLRALGFERGKVKLPGARTPINAYKRV
jgi:hypothetical protein